MTRKLADTEGPGRAAQLIGYRILNDNPAIYGYAHLNRETPDDQEPEYFELSAELLEFLAPWAMGAEDLEDLREIVEVQGWTDAELMELANQLGSPDVFLSWLGNHLRRS